MKRKILLLSVVYLTLVNNVHATPDPSNWYKVDLIGANNTNYYYYLTHEELLGSYYYSFTHYYLVSRNIKTGSIDRKVLLKKTKNTIIRKDRDVIDKHENILITDINSMDIISENNVEALYPDVDARKSFKFDKKGMYYVKDNKRINVLTREYLNKFLIEYEEWYDWKNGISIIQVYSNRDYHFYILQYGTGGDIDFFQAILPIRRNIVRQ